jgi:hypothetical protein
LYLSNTFPDRSVELQRTGLIAMRKDPLEIFTEEKRRGSRSTQLQNYRVEIKLVGEPIYQFRVVDVSSKGAGLLVNESSRFLEKIKVGQVVDADFISPQGSNPSGLYHAEIRHITQADESRYKGLQLVGILILEKLIRA